MPTTDYIRHHLYGAWRLLRGDFSGFDHFDLTTEGFKRSFWAIALGFIVLIPILISDHRAALAYAALSSDYEFAVPQSVYLVTEIATGVAGWIIFLVLMVPLSRNFGVAERYVPYVIIYNWASLLIICLSLPLSIAGLSGVMGWEFVLPFQLILALVFLAYAWFIAMSALGLSRLDAAAVVALETLVFLVLSYPARGIYTLYGS